MPRGRPGQTPRWARDDSERWILEALATSEKGLRFKELLKALERGERRVSKQTLTLRLKSFYQEKKISYDYLSKTYSITKPGVDALKRSFLEIEVGDIVARSSGFGDDLQPHTLPVKPAEEPGKEPLTERPKTADFLKQLDEEGRQGPELYVPLRFSTVNVDFGRAYNYIEAAEGVESGFYFAKKLGDRLRGEALSRWLRGIFSLAYFVSEGPLPKYQGIVGKGYFKGEKKWEHISDEELDRLWSLFRGVKRTLLVEVLDLERLLSWLKTSDGKAWLQETLEKTPLKPKEWAAQFPNWPTGQRIHITHVEFPAEIAETPTAIHEAPQGSAPVYSIGEQRGWCPKCQKWIPAQTHEEFMAHVKTCKGAA